MTKPVPAAFLILALAAAAPLGAADWDGLHWGFSTGYATGQGKVRVDPLPSAAVFNVRQESIHTNPKGALLGGQFGQNWISGRQVYGYEADLAWMGAKGEKTITPVSPNGTPDTGDIINAKTELKAFGSLRGRCGFLVSPTVLVYGTAGLGFASIKGTAIIDPRPNYGQYAICYPVSASKTQVGFTGGLGGEWIVSPGMTVRAEALYADLGKRTDASARFQQYQVKYTFETKETLLRVGMNFKF